MIEPPYDGMKLLKEYADKHDMGVASAFDENCGVIIMGKRKLHVNEVAVVCAAMLLNGIMNGAWTESQAVSEAGESNDAEKTDRVQ